jgi:hypothetical protein
MEEQTMPIAEQKDQQNQALVPVLSYEQQVKDIAVAVGTSERALMNLAKTHSLAIEEVKLLAELQKDYNAKPYTLSTLLKEGCSVYDICMLYDTRDACSSGLIKNNGKGRDMPSLKKMYELWQAFGGGEISEDMLSDMLVRIGDTRPDLWLNEKIKLALNLHNKRGLNSLEHICDLLEGSGLTQDKQYREDFLDSAEYSREHRED